ncbi:MAG: lysylphosphatidylglycerol synthase domain-containing protein [Pirellulales bacterium]|nr:lysylphosphatidylglycerol synthase domain-containing protein [Pirellulales bacterium]
MSPAVRSWLLILGKLAILALLLWAISGFVGKALEQLRERPLQIRPGWFALAGALYLLGLAPCAWFWRRVLLYLGQRPGRYETWRAYYIGHLGKYLPGKAMVVALRTGLLASARVDAAVAVASIFYETLSMMAVGAVVGGVLVAVVHRQQTSVLYGACAMAVVAGLPLVPAVFRFVAKLARLDRRSPQAAEGLGRLNIADILPGWLAIAGGWLVLGASMLATISALGGQHAHPFADWLLCSAVVALASTGGFLSLVPGGAGVREMLIIPLLAPRYGEAVALGAAVLWRMASLLAELVLSAILYPVRGAPREASSASATSPR